MQVVWCSPSSAVMSKIINTGLLVPMWCLPPARPFANILSFTPLSSPERKILRSQFKKRGLGGSDWLSDLLKDMALSRERRWKFQARAGRLEGLFPSPTLRTLTFPGSQWAGHQLLSRSSQWEHQTWPFVSEGPSSGRSIHRLEMSNPSPTPKPKCVASVKLSTLKKMSDDSKCKARLGVGSLLFPCGPLHSKEGGLNMEETHPKWSFLGLIWVTTHDG